MSRFFTRTLWRTERDALSVQVLRKGQNKKRTIVSDNSYITYQTQPKGYFQYLLDAIFQSKPVPINSKEYSTQNKFKLFSSINLTTAALKQFYYVPSHSFSTSSDQNSRGRSQDSSEDREHDDHDKHNENDSSRGLYFILKEVLPVAIISSALVIIFQKLFRNHDQENTDESSFKSIADLDGERSSIIGLDCETFDDARGLSLTALINALGFTSLCLQESITALHDLKTRLSQREKATSLFSSSSSSSSPSSSKAKTGNENEVDDDEESSEIINQIERHLLVEYERAVEDLQTRLEKQQRALVWAFQHALAQVSPQYGLSSELSTTLSPQARDKIRTKQLVELDYFITNLPLAVVRDRSSEELEQLNTWTSVINASGMFSNSPDQGQQSSSSSSSQISTSRLDPSIVQSYQLFLQQVLDSTKPYYTALPNEMDKVSESVYETKRFLSKLSK